MAGEGGSGMAPVHQQRLRLWQDRVETLVDVQGSGPPLVFLHGHWGLRPDSAFLERLARPIRSMHHGVRGPARAIRRRFIRSTTGGT